jgi:hypothetical protein
MRAWSEATFIGHPAARVIASMYHEGQTSPTYELASTGYVPPEPSNWTYLVRRVLVNINDESTGDEITVITSLVQYILSRVQNQIFGTIPNWSSFWL